MDETASEFRAGWKIVLVAALGVGVGLNGALFYTLGVFMKPLSDAFGWTRTEISGGAPFLVLGSVVGAPFIGRLADRIGVKTIAVLSLIGLSIALTGMTRLNANVDSYYLGLGLVALLGCGTNPVIWTLAVSTWFRQSRGLALGATLAGTGLAAILAPVYVSALIDSFGWRAGYLGLAMASLAITVPVWSFFDKRGQGIVRAASDAPTALAGRTVREAAGTVHFWKIGIAFLVVSGALAGLIVHLLPMLADAGIPRPIAVKLASAIGFAVVAGRLGVGYLVDRLHPPYVAAAFLSAPGFACLLLIHFAGMPWIVVIASLLFGFAAGAEIDLIAYLTSRYFGLKSYGEIYGWQLMAFGLGAGFGPLLVGSLRAASGNYSSALYSALLAFSVGAALIATLGRAPIFQPLAELEG